MFTSFFSEGDAAAAALAAEHPGDCCPRRIIRMEEDFEVVHNVIFYIYTQEIFFSTKSSDSTDSDFPRPCDAEEVYALAHRLELEDLKVKALSFLKLSCNPRNIISRVLGKYASVYDEMGCVYSEYLRKNWTRIRNTAEFEAYFADLAETGDPEEIIRSYDRFRELMKDAAFPNPLSWG